MIKQTRAFQLFWQV